MRARYADPTGGRGSVFCSNCYHSNWPAIGVEGLLAFKRGADNQQNPQDLSALAAQDVPSSRYGFRLESYLRLCLHRRSAWLNDAGFRLSAPWEAGRRIEQ
jgi:hypothetical protein